MLFSLIKKSEKLPELDQQLEKNDYISHIYKTINEHNPSLQQIDQTKYHALRIINLIYQNVHEEYLEYSVEALAYLLKHPNQLNAKFSF